MQVKSLKYYSVFFGTVAWLAVFFSGSPSAMAADDRFRVYADSVEAGRGEDVAVRFSLANELAVSSATVPVVYDTEILTLKSLSFTGSRAQHFENKLTTPASIEDIDGHFMVAVFQVFEDPIPAGDGLLFTAVFSVNPAAEIGTVTVLDTLFYPPGGNLIVVRADQPGAVYPLFEAGKVVVGDDNRSPVIASIPDQYVLEGDSLDLTISVTDPDNDAVTLAITSKPVGATFVDNGDGTGRLVWVPDYVGPNSADGSPIEIGFWASDGDLASNQTLTVYVINRNRGPVIEGPEAVSVEAGKSLEFSLSAFDPDFEDMVWSWSNLPAGASFDARNPAHFTWQSALTDSGSTTMQFVAADPQGLTDTLHVQLGVRAVSLYTLSIDSVLGIPGEEVDFAVRLDNRFPVASFNVLFNYDQSALTLLSMTSVGTRSETFEYFNVVENDDGIPGNVRIVGVVDVGGGGLLAAGEGPIAAGQFRVSGDLAFAGMSVPMFFRFLDSPINEDNTLTDSLGVKIQQENIVYISGSVLIQDIGDILIGDINLNRIAAEIGDVIYFTNHFINPQLYSFDALQYANSDVNGDKIPATVSDLVALIAWVVAGTPYPAKMVSMGEPTAEIWRHEEAGGGSVGFESDSDIGAALAVLRTSSTVYPDMIENLSDGMDLVYRQDGEEVKILMYSWSGESLPAGRTGLFAIHGLEEFQIVSVEMGSAEGRNVRVSLGGGEESLPQEYALAQNYPNPFNPETVIEFSLPRAAEVELTIYNVLGQQVRTLAEGFYPAGDQTVTWDATDDQGRRVASGLYLYRLKAGTTAITRKMMLLK